MKEYIKELLTEEIITVSRGSNSFMYDATFNKKGNIVKAKKISVGQDLVSLISIAKKYTTAPEGVIYEFLKSAINSRILMQQPVTDWNLAVAELNGKGWITTIAWSPTNEKGRGEAGIHLAFKANETEKEPDFVSSDNKKKISIKYLKEATSTARSSGKTEVYQKIINKITAPEVLPDLDKSNITYRSLSAALQDSFKYYTKVSGSPEGFVQLLKTLDAQFKELKLEILKEWGAEGIIACNDSKFEYIPANETAREKIHILSIRSGRVDFKVSFDDRPAAGIHFDIILNNFIKAWDDWIKTPAD